VFSLFDQVEEDYSATKSYKSDRAMDEEYESMEEIL